VPQMLEIPGPREFGALLARAIADGRPPRPVTADARRRPPERQVTVPLKD